MAAQKEFPKSIKAAVEAGTPDDVYLPNLLGINITQLTDEIPKDIMEWALEHEVDAALVFAVVQICKHGKCSDIMNWAKAQGAKVDTWTDRNHARVEKFWVAIAGQIVPAQLVAHDEEDVFDVRQNDYPLVKSKSI